MLHLHFKLSKSSSPVKLHRWSNSNKIVESKMRLISEISIARQQMTPCQKKWENYGAKNHNRSEQHTLDTLDHEQS